MGWFNDVNQSQTQGQSTVRSDATPAALLERVQRARSSRQALSEHEIMLQVHRVKPGDLLTLRRTWEAAHPGTPFTMVQLVDSIARGSGV